MPDIPRAVLSEQFQDCMENRRLVSAVFTTFRFDPGFFESEVLPVFFDVSFSHANAIKLVQLNDVIAKQSVNLAVYYDRSGLVAEGASAKLDVQRIPIQHPTGIFHPKNVLALVEDVEPDEQTGLRRRALLCACLSANLTRAGWWENVEVSHIEKLDEGEATNLRVPLLEYLDRLVNTAEFRRPNDELRRRHAALWDIRKFLEGCRQRDQRSVDGHLRTQFHNGSESLPDFIANSSANAVRGMCLEILSPYIDGGDESAPLAALMEQFQPRDVRVHLPRNERGEAQCSQSLYEGMTEQGVTWGELPRDLLRMGKSEEARLRTVHAKVYRFFEPKRGGREILYVGSTNMTQAGCRVAGKGGNWETGFLVENVPHSAHAKPDWWLAVDEARPTHFVPRSEDEGTAASGGTQLAVRYAWNRREAAVFWRGKGPSPVLSVEHAGVRLFELSSLPPREWQVLDAETAKRLEQTLLSTSFLQVRGEGSEPGVLLVQEEGMAQRPSLLLELSPADILRYWALLTVEQRAEFIAAHVRLTGDDDPLMAKLAPLPNETTLFDRFAGIFHAFSCLEARVREALDDGKVREADYRLFGRKYDSLGSLLDRVLMDAKEGRGDRVEHYVVVLCARQLMEELGGEPRYQGYWAEHRDDVRQLQELLASAGSLRETLATSSGEMPAFLDWFDGWFLQRAEPLPPAEDAA
ncbi:hypothetical protein D7X55_05130 [Corallococcus sp. AB049A]|uniref:hypothetical protein n=1 Tax=Corallococcus sp. AB049A TaxID=2316721 RepID=UPI000EC0961D|nr:hypothetical protein [Corallococcus sp. AB049A]RKI73517.1 hypothetical protein D7X55_05130 [Corallococcus sp. AB049A]